MRNSQGRVERAAVPEMAAGDGALEAVLDQVIRIRPIVQQGARVATEAGNATLEIGQEIQGSPSAMGGAEAGRSGDAVGGLGQGGERLEEGRAAGP